MHKDTSPEIESGRAWLEVARGLYRYQDSCMVYALDVGDQMIAVNAGTGEWVDSMDELPKPVRKVFLTHFFRDHSAGAVDAARLGMEIWASGWEQEQLADPAGLFSRRETYIIYDNNWDLFAPTEAVPVSRWLLDYERIEIGDAIVEVLPAPGASLGAVALGVEIDGRRILFAGEAIHSSGKILRLAPLQYN